jgi:very-short-patch-repair endonuclease
VFFFPSCQGGVPPKAAGWYGVNPVRAAGVARSMRVNNLPSRKEQRRALRARLTREEALLWIHVRGRQLQGRKFRRQHSVGPYILDFYCPSEKLAVELDGASHDHDAAQRRDGVRTAFLQDAGIRVIRFENKDVRENPDGVLAEIARCFGSP